MPCLGLNDDDFKGESHTRWHVRLWSHGRGLCRSWCECRGEGSKGVASDLFRSWGSSSHPSWIGQLKRHPRVHGVLEPPSSAPRPSLLPLPLPPACFSLSFCRSTLSSFKGRFYVKYGEALSCVGNPKGCFGNEGYIRIQESGSTQQYKHTEELQWALPWTWSVNRIHIYRNITGLSLSGAWTTTRVKPLMFTLSLELMHAVLEKISILVTIKFWCSCGR